jgi:hypothetical protein
MNPLNRRSLFGFLATAPVAVPLAAKAMMTTEVVAAPVAAVEAVKFTPPVGYIMDFIENFAAPCHHHGYSNMVYSQSCVMSRYVQKIWDGHQFVPLDGPYGESVRARVRG